MKPYFIEQAIERYTKREAGRFIRRLMLFLLLLALGGCATLGYYGQSIGGQWEVWEKRQPIDELLAAPETDDALRKKLQTVLAIRDFASKELALPDNDSYRSYADLQRPFVVWNVFAAKPFELKLKRWCFPFAGCVGYRGYFAKADAQTFAAELAAEGMDVYVGGVAAYSTLGWFDDPVLNTVMKRSPARLAGLIFHELAHQQLYVEGDTAFNEGFATTVQLEGVRRWLEKFGDESSRQRYAQYQQRQEDFVTLVTDARNRLQTLYAQALVEQTLPGKTQTEQTISEQNTQARKAAILDELREAYQQRKKQWDGYNGYDAWFAQDLNNAQLAAVTTYRDHVPAFQRVLAEQGGDMAAFYRVCEALGEMSAEQRQTALAAKGSAPVPSLTQPQL